MPNLTKALSLKVSFAHDLCSPPCRTPCTISRRRAARILLILAPQPSARSIDMPTIPIDVPTAVQSGIVSSGNSLDFTMEDLHLFEAHGVAVKEMEAAAVAWAAHLHATPVFALKAITDIVDGVPPGCSALSAAQTDQVR